MANLTGSPTYQAFVRALETSDPAHPDTWNNVNQDLINNDAYLKQEIENNDTEISALQSDLESLATSDPEEIKAAVGLDWLYNQSRIYFELFSYTYILRDMQTPLTGVVTVNGDDSVDISDTSGLEVGHEYVVFDGGSAENVVVAEIFSATRFRAESALSVDIGDGRLSSTNLAVAGSEATAETDDVYFAHNLSLDNADDAAAIIRHTGSVDDLRLYYQDDTHGSWTEAYWAWSRDIETGVIDVEYRLPVSGTFSLKLVCENTSDVTISHLVLVTAATGLGGTHNAPTQPVNSSPVDDATGIGETPTLQGSTYSSPVDSPQQALQVQIDTDGGDFSSPLHDSGTEPAGTSYSVPAALLSASTAYEWRLRCQDGEGAWSEWSTATGFTTAASFERVDTPVNSSPANGQTSVPEQPSLNASEFQTDGLSLTSLSDGGTTDLWTNSGTTGGEYYYTGAAIGGQPCKVYADGTRLTEGTLGSLSNGEFAWGDQDTIGEDTLYVKTADGDPDGQAADYIQADDVHTKSQWQIRAAAGSYDSPPYDSGDSTDLESHTVPAGNLEEGENTYYFRVRYYGENIGWSEWSSETNFVTKDMFAQIFGIALVSTGGGAGSWQQIDADGNNISPTTTDFNNSTIWGGIEDAIVDGQTLGKIPKCYVKTGTAPAGSDQAGNPCWWVSDADIDGYQVHPAFMDAETEIDQVYVGRYECVDDPEASGTKAASLSGSSPLVSIDFSTMQSRCEARNTGGVDGFHLWSIYEVSLVQLLALIELGTPDAQSAVADGNVSSSAAENTGSTAAVWRGFYELWGNVRHMVDGLQLDGSHQVKIWDINGNTTIESTGVNTTSTNGWGVTLHDEADTNWDLSLIFLPKTVDGTEGNGTLADYLYASDAGEDNVCYHGGVWSYGSKAGLFYLDLRDGASDSYTSRGGRLAKW